MKAYLITGAAGFVGAAVAHQLLSEGNAVCAIDELNGAYDVQLKEWRLHQLQTFPHFSFYRTDISQKGPLLEVIEDYSQRTHFSLSAILNLAARAGVRASVENPWIYIDTNITGTLNLLELARQKEIKKFVLASTSSLYGEHNKMPFEEDGDSSHPLSPYAASKKGAEALCYSYHTLYHLDVSILRYFTVYGPAGRPDMSLFRFIQSMYENKPLTIFGDGSQKRDFTYIDDIARGTVRALRPLGYQIINLGSDQPIEVCSVIELLEQITGLKAELQFVPAHPADVAITWANIKKASQLLNWSPETNFKQGLSKLNHWYLQERSWLKNVRLNH